MRRITHYEIKHIQSLRRSRYRYEGDQFWAEGVRTIDGLLEAGAQITKIYISQGFEKPKHWLDNIPISYCTDKDSNRIKSTQSFPGIGAIVEIPQDSRKEEPHIVAIDGLQDPGNLGTIIRSARWFGVNQFIINSDGVDPYNEKVVRSTMGAIAASQFFVVKNLTKKLEDLKKKDYFIISTSLTGTDYTRLTKPNRWVLILGSEAHGVSPEASKLAHQNLKIPKRGQGESLNVAVAAGIFLNHLTI